MTLTRTDLPLGLLRRGKVRDVYEVDRDRVLLVATDRVSAFDVVMAEPIPHKGAVLTQLTAWWLRGLQSEVRHHMVTADTHEIIEEIPSLDAFAAELAGRAMLCVRAEVYPVECVIRGYISGSAWKEYSAHGTLAGEPLPPGLRESDRLPVPVFSPATKAEEGHDENITIATMKAVVGEEQTLTLEKLTRLVYAHGGATASERGIIIADTKLEFGYERNTPGAGDEFDPSRVILVDEVLTPDSSRFWPSDRYTPGGPQPSFDKQPLRDYLEGERVAGRWNGEHPAPPLPEEVVDATSRRYLEIFRRLTLAPLAAGADH